MRRRRAGVLIAIEGIDGTGKSTLQRELARRWRRSGYRVRLTQEPADVELGRRGQRTGASDPWAGAMYFTLDRILSRPAVERALAGPRVVLSDRSYYSTIAYQGSLLSTRERRRLAEIQRKVTAAPDRVVLLRLDPDEAMRRLGSRGSRRSPLERRRILTRVARAYDRLAREHRWLVVDARGSPAEVAEAVDRPLLRLLRRRLGAGRRRR